MTTNLEREEERLSAWIAAGLSREGTSKFQALDLLSPTTELSILFIHCALMAQAQEEPLNAKVLAQKLIEASCRDMDASTRPTKSASYKVHACFVDRASPGEAFTTEIFVIQLQRSRRERTMWLAAPADVSLGLVFLLTRIGSWTNARWDQHHLRERFGDDNAESIIRWLAERGIRPHIPEGMSGRRLQEETPTVHNPEERLTEAQHCFKAASYCTLHDCMCGCNGCLPHSDPTAVKLKQAQAEIERLRDDAERRIAELRAEGMSANLRDADASPRPRRRWEYETLCLDAEDDADQEKGAMNKLGAEGWELVSTFRLSDDGTYLFFKRPVL